MPMKNPPHPGDFIRTEIIEPAGLSVTAAAAALNVSRPALSSLVNSKADLSGDMALRIEKAFGVKMDTLMRMQASYDIAQTRKPACSRLTQQPSRFRTSRGLSVVSRLKCPPHQLRHVPLSNPQDIHNLALVHSSVVENFQRNCRLVKERNGLTATAGRNHRGLYAPMGWSVLPYRTG